MARQAEVKIAQISHDLPFCYRHNLRDSILEKSIRKRGILMPMVVRKQKGKYQIIAGYRRLEAARSLKLKNIPVFEIAEKINAKDAFVLCLLSNWRQETSDVDRARAVSKAVREFKFDSDETRDIVMPLLGLPTDQNTLDLYLKADAMPDSLKGLFEEKRIPFRGCVTLLRFSKKEQDCFAKKIGTKMRLTTSQFVQAADWLVDIVKRDKVSLESVLKREPFRKILSHAGMDPRTRAGHFFNAVKQVRFPGYSDYLQKFEKARSKILREVRELGIDPPAGFEERGVDLRVRLKSPKDLDRILQKLSEGRSALNSLFDFML